jgi:hypothetical protein
MRRRDLLLAPAPLLAQSEPARNIILFTSDGLRWQDAFHGIDPVLMGEKEAHMDQARHLRDLFWRESPDQRREALMPEFWRNLAPQATVSSNVAVTNAFRVSYPGYSEIMTGRAQDEAIRGNDPKQNPTETFLEFLRRKWGLQRRQVAVFGSWNAFQWMSERTPGSITINAGYAAIGGTPRLEELSRMQREIMTEDETARHDWITVEMALEYMRQFRPRVLYVALNETDKWAHHKRYDRYLHMVHYVDRCLGQFWSLAQSMPDYKGSTALVVTADHGRGATLADWTSHGRQVEGAERIWLAVAGANRPDAAALARRQCDIAPMILRMVGVDPNEYLRG